VHAQRAFATALGGIPYPLLADFEPKGKVCQDYDLYNHQRGTCRRAVVLVDREGVVRWVKVYEDRSTPDPQEVLAQLDGL